MRYAIARFRKEIPSIPGMSLVASFDHYQIYSFEDDASWNAFPEGVAREEIEEIEGTTAWRFYGEVRGYRSAYSDLEGLVPDSQNGRGVNKTKVYMTPEIEAATLMLMKRILKRNIIDEYEQREDKSGEQELLDYIDTIDNIKQVSYEKERLLGIEMSKTQLQELGLWNAEINLRNGPMVYELGF